MNKIDRYDIEYAEQRARANGGKDLAMFADVAGTAMNLLLDKVDELVEQVNQLQEELTALKEKKC